MTGSTLPTDGTRPRRMRKSQTDPAVWIAHKKQRKKIASAKWYATKMQRIREKHRIRLEQKQKRLYRNVPGHPLYNPSETERADLQCRMEHRVNGWPPRVPTIAPEQWLEILQLAKESVDAMQLDPATEPEKIRICRGLCVEEIKRQCLEWNQSMDRVRERCQHPTSLDPNREYSWTDRCLWTLTKGMFPTVCTSVGLVFVNLVMMGKQHWWPAVVRHLYDNQITDPNHTMMLPNQYGQNPATNTPHSTPHTNA